MIQILPTKRLLRSFTHLTTYKKQKITIGQSNWLWTLIFHWIHRCVLILLNAPESSDMCGIALKGWEHFTSSFSNLLIYTISFFRLTAPQYSFTVWRKIISTSSLDVWSLHIVVDSTRAFADFIFRDILIRVIGFQLDSCSAIATHSSTCQKFLIFQLRPH